MNFLIQKENNYDFDIETEAIYQYLLRQGRQHEVLHADMAELSAEFPARMDIKNWIPIGSIEFVEKFLQKYHGIDHMSPLEVPLVLRKPEYLLRDYRIVGADALPREGVYFIKDISRLKQFTYCGELSIFLTDEVFKGIKNDYSLYINPDHKFVVSDALNIMSEYRVFVHNDKIKGIQFYDGDLLVMPTPDEIRKLRSMVSNYMVDDTRPKAYAMDIAVVKKDGGRDIALIEMCPFSCCGLYGFYSEEIASMFKDGFRWFIEYNKGAAN